MTVTTPLTTRSDVRFASRGSSHFDVLLALFVVVLVVSNIAATKSIEFGSGSWSIGSLQLWPVVTDGGAFLFPLAYIVGDVISEVYGFKAARRAVLMGFAAAILAAAQPGDVVVTMGAGSIGQVPAMTVHEASVR